MPATQCLVSATDMIARPEPIIHDPDPAAENRYRELYRQWRAAHLTAARAEERALQALDRGTAKRSSELAHARMLRRRADEALHDASHAAARLVER